MINTMLTGKRMHEEITGVILVGGTSSRMGKDKAFLEVCGKPIFERILEVFSENFSRVVLVGNRPERFAPYGLPVFADIYTGSSLGGLYTGLFHAETRYVFVSSCDIPYPSGNVLRYLCSVREGYDAVVVKTEHGFEPLFALYSKSCLGAIKSLLDSGECCAYAYFPEIRIRYVLATDLASIDPEGRSFINVNTPDQYARVAGDPERQVNQGTAGDQGPLCDQKLTAD